MPGKWNVPRTVGSRRVIKPIVPGARIQKIVEETRQRVLDSEKKTRSELATALDQNNLLLQNGSPEEQASSVDESTPSENAANTGKKMLRVLIADDHPVVREGLTTIIQLQPNMRVVAEASNGREAMEKFFEIRPDIALLDLRMPLMDGVATVIAVCEKEPSARLAILTSFESEEEIYRALRAGAQGYVLKDAPAADLIACIQAMSEGRTWIPPGIGAKLAKRVTGKELTTREMEVLRTMVLGKSNKEIGVLLDIAESTVKVHVTHVLEKLKASGRTEAISVALKRGLIRMDSAQG
jgi:two-component system, NarL family, response regulator